MELSDEIASNFISHAIDVSRFEEDLKRRALFFLRLLEDELAQRINAELGTSYSQARLQALQRQAKATIASAYDQVEKTMMGFATDFGRLEQKVFLEAVNSAIGVRLLTTTLTPKQLKVITSKSLIFGTPSELWWRKQKTDLQHKFMAEIRMGLYQGETLSQLVQRIRGKATGKKHIYYIPSVSMKVRHLPLEKLV